MVFHLIAGVAILGGAAGEMISGGGLAGGGGATAIDVTLVGSDLQPASAVAGSPWILRARPGAPDEHPIPTVQDAEDQQMSRLMEAVRAKASQPPSEAASASPAGSRTTSAATNGLDEIDRSIRGPDGATASTGGLWGQIAPCWRALPVRAQTPVSLEVILDATGSLRRPPRVIRPANEPVPDARLKAEAQALAALSACMPRHDLRFAGGVYRLDFGPKS